MLVPVLRPETIRVLWEALQQPIRRTQWEMSSILNRIVREGWAYKVDVEDILMSSDVRADRRDLDIKELSAALRLEWRNVYPRPNASEKEVWGHEAISAPDLAALLIVLERLGFQIDPLPLVDALLPSVRQQRFMTDSDLSMHWFKKNRYSYASIELAGNERGAGAQDCKKVVLPTGYRAELWLDAKESPALLSVLPPKRSRQSSRGIVSKVEA